MELARLIMVIHGHSVITHLVTTSYMEQYISIKKNKKLKMIKSSTIPRLMSFKHGTQNLEQSLGTSTVKFRTHFSMMA